MIDYLISDSNDDEIVGYVSLYDGKVKEKNGRQRWKSCWSAKSSEKRQRSKKLVLVSSNLC